MIEPEEYKKILEIELARAEAVIRASESDTKQSHAPTLEHHKGQAFAFRKAIHFLANSQVILRKPLEIVRTTYLEISWSVVVFYISLFGFILFL